MMPTDTIALLNLSGFRRSEPYVLTYRLYHHMDLFREMLHGNATHTHIQNRVFFHLNFRMEKLQAPVLTSFTTLAQLVGSVDISDYEVVLRPKMVIVSGKYVISDEFYEKFFFCIKWVLRSCVC